MENKRIKIMQIPWFQASQDKKKVSKTNFKEQDGQVMRRNLVQGQPWKKCETLFEK
jgi:hypothetical protein